MTRAARVLQALAAWLVFALVGALTGVVAAAFIGVALLQPIADAPGIAQAIGALLIAGAALGAVFGLYVLHRL